jgi:hypothetical protein
VIDPRVVRKKLEQPIELLPSRVPFPSLLADAVSLCSRALRQPDELYFLPDVLQQISPVRSHARKKVLRVRFSV